VDDRFWASKRVGFGWEKQVTVRGGCGGGGCPMRETVGLVSPATHGGRQ